MKKKVLGLITAIVIIISAAISVNAAARAFSASIELKVTDSVVTTSIITAKNVSVHAENDASSAHMVWAVAQYLDGPNYDNKEARYIHVGDKVDFTSYQSTTSSWYLELNPTGAYKNCSGRGTITAI